MPSFGSASVLTACAIPTCEPRRLASYTPDIAACAEELAGQLDEAARSGQAIDFYQHAGRVAMDMTGATVFGCACRLDPAHAWSGLLHTRTILSVAASGVDKEHDAKRAATHSVICRHHDQRFYPVLDGDDVGRRAQ